MKPFQPSSPFDEQASLIDEQPISAASGAADGVVAVANNSLDVDVSDEKPTASPQQLRRRVVSLAAPVIGENLLQTLLGVVDTILVAGVGAAALAGVGAALQVIYVIVAALSALTVGASVLVAQAIGADNPRVASSYARQSIVWSLVISIPLTIFGVLLTRPIIDLFGMTPDVTQIAVDYLHVTIGTIFTLTVMLLAGGVLRGTGDSRTPMFVTALANIINVGLAYVLIYGVAGMPALGAVGSAWATFAARLIGAALLVWVLVRGRNGVRISGNGIWWPQLSTARQVFRIGVPAALEEVLIITAFAAMTPIVAALGTLSLAAHRVVINILSLSFLPGIGFGLAATALVGQSIGARTPRDAQDVVAIAVRWALIWMSTLAVLFVVFAPQLMYLFTIDPAMVTIGTAAIRVVAFTQPFWAISFVYAGALRGTGNTQIPLLITGSMVWLAVALGYAAITLIGTTLVWLWAAFLVTGPIESFAFWWAWRRWAQQHIVTRQNAAS